MAAKEEMIILSKIDILSTEDIAEKKAYFEKETGKKVLFSISAGAYIHIDELKNYLVEKIDDPILSRGTYIAPAVTEDIESGMQNAGEKIPNYTKIYDLKAKNDPRKFKLSRESDGMFVVAGDRIEEIVRMTDMRYEDGVNRVYDIMEKVGIIRKIKTILTTEMLANKTGWFE
jgi:GTP-binding protein